MATGDTKAMALRASPTEEGRAAEALLRASHDFVEPKDADLVIALGGDGFLLETLHGMLDSGCVKPVFGMNRGTVGFLMNDWGVDGLASRVARAKAISVAPLSMRAVTIAGDIVEDVAFNEVSLLRETRQTAWIEISVRGRVVMPQLVADGVMVATPVGSTAYNLSAHGPILPLQSKLVALTPISPFRPRRWRGALIPEDIDIAFRVLDSAKRPVSAVADNLEVREVDTVSIRVDRTRALTLLFDPEHALDERIAMEQFAS